MRIAYVTETWPPEVNGVANSAFRTVSFLRSRLHEVTVVRPRQKRAEVCGDTLLVAGIAIPLYPDLRMGLPVTRQLMRQWNVCRPDIVHVATEGPLGWAAITAATRLGISVTSDFRTRFDRYAGAYALSLFEPVVRSYLKRFHNRCRRTFVPTQELSDELCTKGFERLVVSARGVDCSLFDPVHRSADLRGQWGSTRLAALYVGRLAPEKNLSLLAPTMCALEHAIPGLVNIIVGDGPEHRRLKEQLPQAVFLGVQRGASLAQIYASADLFIFPVNRDLWQRDLGSDGFCLPVVAFDTAAARVHIVDGVNGAKVPCSDRAAFVQSALDLARKVAQDPGVGRAAREAALQADWSAILRGFESTLIDTVNQERPMNIRYRLDRSQWLEHDRRWAQTLNRAAAWPHLLLACRIASRLGDGVLWYATMIVLALVAGREGLECAEQMFLAGAVSLGV